MTIPIIKRQHLVPRFYLNSFSTKMKNDSNKVFCYFKQQKNKVLRLPVENIAVKKFFYDANRLPQPIENFLSSAESDLSKTYHKVVREKSIKNLNEKERENLVYLVYFQYIRTEYTRTKTIQIINNALQLYKKEYLRNHTIEDWMEYKKYGLTKHPIKLQKLLIVVNDAYVEYWKNKVPQPTLKIIEIMLNLKNKILNTFFNLSLILYEIKIKNFEFYTSDHPVLFYTKRSFEDDEGLTFLNIHNPHTKIYYPLSPKLCLNLYNSKIFIDYKKKYPSMKKEIYKSDIKDVIIINRLVTHEAY